MCRGCCGRRILEEFEQGYKEATVDVDIDGEQRFPKETSGIGVLMLLSHAIALADGRKTSRRRRS